MVIHWLSHRKAFLWRLHETDHSDADFDASTGVRFHPLESLLRATGASAVIATGAVPVSAAVVYSLAMEAFSYVQHANAAVPERLDRIVRAVFLSTNAHRNHHAVDPGLHDSNHGVLLSIWDRAFGTWTEPVEVNDYGVADVPADQGSRFWFLLTRPFQTRRAIPQPAAGARADVA